MAIELKIDGYFEMTIVNYETAEEVDEQEDGNVLTKRTETIKEIKSIIKEFGSFGVGELQTDSISIRAKGNLIHLAEQFKENEIEVEVYREGDSFSVDYYTLSYEELDEDTLEEILELCKEWEEGNNEYMDFEID
jgi:uncharacterized protein related to proFAR isomerase